MIAYYCEYSKTHSDPMVERYDGPVVMEGENVWLGADKSAPVVRLVTLFDDSQVPPRLIRADYSGTMLNSLGAKLPPLFIGFNEAICDATGRIVFEGPRAGEQ